MFNKVKRFDKLWIGFIAGIIGPVGGFWLFYLLKFRARTPEYYIHLFLNVKEYQSPILSLSVIVNAAILWLFLNGNNNRAGRGVLLATFLYVPVIVYLFLSRNS
jgi:hypothetical protein